MRQLAGYLAMPIFVVDPEGNLLFYNEPAEALLGRRFDEAGPMPAAEWSTAFSQRHEDGSPLPPAELPLMIALRDHQPAHRTFLITGHDGISRRIGVTAFPLEGRGGWHLGAVAVFWASTIQQEEATLVPVPPPAARPGPAPQRELELILMRRLAQYLAIPMMVIDRWGNLLFFNTPAEAILGRRFAATGALSLEEWTGLLPLCDENGSPIPPEARPVILAVRERRPTHSALQIGGLDGRTRRIESTVMPLEGQGGRLLGAVALFWETKG